MHASIAFIANSLDDCGLESTLDSPKSTEQRRETTWKTAKTERADLTGLKGCCGACRSAAERLSQPGPAGDKTRLG